MDSITQAALGAAIGHVILAKKIGGKGAILGAVVATIPDLDIILLPFFDDVQRISVHRGFSHSIVFSFIGALLIAFILSRIKWTAKMNFWKLSLFSWLALFTHMLLDAFTAYGTQLFLPFSDYRVSFDSVNIVDPVYTVPLLLGVIIGLYYSNKGQRSNANNIGLIVSTVYLLFTLGHKVHVGKNIKSDLSEQSINYASLRTIPVGIGNVNWYGVAKSQDSLFLGKYSDLDHNHIEFHSFPINNSLLDRVDKRLADKLKWFSQDYYTVAEYDGKIRLYNLQCDMQGIRTFGAYKAPTAFYFEITPFPNGKFELTTGMHPKND